jgi:protein-tyrosine phosphatase
VIAIPERHLPLDGTRNVRDVGGYPTVDGRQTRWRTLLRSDELTRIPPHARA